MARSWLTRKTCQQCSAGRAVRGAGGGVYSPHHSSVARLLLCGLAGVLVLTLLGSASPPVPAPSPNPMDEPLRLLALARRSFASVRDYTCLLVKRERLEGQLGPANVIQMKFRKEPFSVGLHWQEPKHLTGQEAYYVHGRHHDKLRVKSAGMLGLFGFISLDLDDSRVKASSHHPITQAGIGNLIDRYEQAWQHERSLNLSQVKIAEYEYNERRCWRVETIHPLLQDSTFLYYRNVLYFDQASKLPIRVECYDWPTRPDDVQGTLAEMLCFAHLRLNRNLADSDFNH